MRWTLAITVIGLTTITLAGAQIPSGKEPLLTIFLSDEGLREITASGCVDRRISTTPGGREMYQVKSACLREWLTPERLAALVRDQGLVMLSSAPESRSGGTETSASGQIRAKCEREWPADYRMQEYCIQRQEEAYRRLQRR